MRISYLADFPEFIPVLAPEIAAHWRPLLPTETAEGRTAQLHTHLKKDALPIAWVAHADGEVFGTAALRVCDLKGREDLSPWLGGVFVRPQYRRQGIASALCAVVEEQAWQLGFNTLYLHTPDQQALYAGLGWQHLEATRWRGHPSDIMRKQR